MRSLALLFLPFVLLAEDAPKLRLDGRAVPERYAADLTLIPGQDEFTGKIDIAISVVRPFSVLWLNASALTISKATLSAGGKSWTGKALPGGDDFAGLDFGSNIPAGHAGLHLEYTGKISKGSSAGVFQLQDGEPWYIYTQFEPTDARRAFPCFDEPNYKTPWALTLHVKNDQQAFANTAAVSETVEPEGMKKVVFAPTRPLPSYLVAFAVGPFEVVDAGKAGRNKTPLRVLVTRGRTQEAKYAAETIPQLLVELEKYFGMPYPYDKLDAISMPISNFAMENVGLITYGQSLLLSRPEADTINRQRGFALVGAHEMAHQWFGDLVTTAWWDDIWLNEAFATWMENRIVDGWKPEWHVMAGAMEARLGAMRLDSLVNARKIRQPILSNDDIANAFDGITYEKGAAVIRMFEQWIGPEKFQKGVQNYMRKYADKNSTAPEFLAAISDAAGRDITSAFNSFLDQAGVPLITVDLRCDSGRPRLQVEQQRSLPIGSKGDAKQNWLVPVCAKYSADGKVSEECHVFSDPKSEVELKNARTCPVWLTANDRGSGYYRVLYRGDMLQRALADHGSRLTPVERIAVLGDVNALVISGQLTPAVALSFVPEFAGDADRNIVLATIEIAGITRGSAVPDALRPAAARFFRKTFGERARQLGWRSKPGDTDDTRILRQNLVATVALAGEDPDLSAEAAKLASAWLDTGKGIDPEMLGGVLSVAARDGDRALFDRMLKAAKESKVRRERQTLIGALGSFRKPELARAAMQLVATGEFDPREGFGPLLFGPGQWPENRRLPFEFVKQNLDGILAKLPREVGADFAAELPFVGGGFCDAPARSELEAFFKDKVGSYTGGPRNFAQVLEGIDLCIARRAAIQDAIADFLRNY